MALLSDHDRQALSTTLSELTEPVRVVFFTQAFGCESCLPAKQILDELTSLSAKITVEEHNLVLEKDVAADYRVDRVPSIVVTGASGRRLTYLGAPSGYEFMSLVEAVRLVSGGDSGLSEANRALVSAVARPLEISVFVTPTCVHCPKAVVLAYRMAIENANIRATAVEATEFPDLARRYRITGVPKTVVDDCIEIFGALPEDEFIAQALKEPAPPPAT